MFILAWSPPWRRAGHGYQDSKVWSQAYFDLKLLRLVCRRWSQVIENDAQFWTAITSNSSTKVVERSLQLSKQASLEISYQDEYLFPANPKGLEMLKGAKGRIGLLNLAAEGAKAFLKDSKPFPQLRELYIRDDALEFALPDAPHLKLLDLWVSSLQRSPQRWAQLGSLVDLGVRCELHPGTRLLDDLVEAMTSFSSLMFLRLDLKARDPVHFSPNSIVGAVTVPQLRSMEINTNARGCAHFLVQAIESPTMKYADIQLYYDTEDLDQEAQLAHMEEVDAVMQFISDHSLPAQSPLLRVDCRHGEICVEGYTGCYNYAGIVQPANRGVFHIDVPAGLAPWDKSLRDKMLKDFKGRIVLVTDCCPSERTMLCLPNLVRVTISGTKGRWGSPAGTLQTRMALAPADALLLVESGALMNPSLGREIREIQTSGRAVFTWHMDGIVCTFEPLPVDDQSVH